MHNPERLSIGPWSNLPESYPQNNTPFSAAAALESVPRQYAVEALSSQRIGA
jgi:hypothetical protein